MGIVYQAECTACGYQGKFLLGSGLGALQLHKNLRCFSEGEQKEILKLEADGRIKEFLVENQLGWCEHCGTLDGKTTLLITEQNSREHLYGNRCTVCKGELVLYGGQEFLKAECPVCRKTKLRFCEAGHWD